MPDPSQPPRMLSAPLRLTAMTLRGRGPYLHGARLDIKPLTILCGENGSGKSIWIDLMNSLQWAFGVHFEQFPWRGLFRASNQDASIAHVDRNNLHSAIVSAACDPQTGEQRDDESIREAREKLFRSDDDEAYGPPGTIGFEITACDDFEMQHWMPANRNPPGSSDTKPEQFIRSGKLERGDTLHIRWCQLRIDSETGDDSGAPVTPLAGLTEMLEIKFNGHHIIRLSHRYGTGEAEDWADLEKDGGLYFTLECSPTFWGGTGTESSIPVTLGMVNVMNEKNTPPVLLAKGCSVSESELGGLYDAVDTIAFHILHQVVVRQFFPIGAVRVTHDAKKTTTTRVTKLDAIRRRYPQRPRPWPSVKPLRRSVQLSPSMEEMLRQHNAEAIKKFEEAKVAREAELAAALASPESSPIYFERPIKRFTAGDNTDPSQLPESDAEDESTDPWSSPDAEISCNGTFRYVGENGQHAQELWARYAYCLMREPGPSFVGEIVNRFVADDFDVVVEAIASLPENVRSRMLEVCDPSLREEWGGAVERGTAYESLALKLLNDLLPRRELFEATVWPQVTGEAASLLGHDGCHLPALTDGEVIRLNRLLLEEAFARDGQRRCCHRTGYLFETYLSYWLKQLTGTVVKYGTYDGPALSQLWKEGNSSEYPPTGGLTEDKGAGSTWMPRGKDFRQDQRQVEPGDSKEDLEHVIAPPTATLLAAWRTMSTGFHQLAPIVIQAGLLQQNELMSVQNPEAHLHPSLQIKVAEFLMHQAMAGKSIIVETHSDLFVRRIMRAIREEHIKQEAVRIYFTHLEDGPEGTHWKHSEMEQLQINDQGQIANWPKGFMDDDLEEANRWLAALERQRSFNDEE